MKFLFSFLFAVLTLIGGFAHAEFQIDTKSQALLGLMNNRDPYPGSGTVLHHTKNAMKCIYDFAVEGGADSALNLLDDQGNSCLLPLNAIVTNVVVGVLTAVTSGGAATVSIGSGIGGSQTDLLGATAKASLASGFVAGVPVGTAATWVGPVTAQGGSQVTASPATATLTAGKLEVYIEYHIQ